MAEVCTYCGKPREENQLSCCGEVHFDKEPETVEELTQMVQWAYSKLHYRVFADPADALMLDKMKLFLEHEILG